MNKIMYKELFLSPKIGRRVLLNRPKRRERERWIVVVQLVQRHDVELPWSAQMTRNIFKNYGEEENRRRKSSPLKGSLRKSSGANKLGSGHNLYHAKEKEEMEI